LQGSYAAKVDAFTQIKNQYELLEPFFDQFYDVIESMIESLPRSKVIKFIKDFCPAGRGSEYDI